MSEVENFVTGARPPSRRPSLLAVRWIRSPRRFRSEVRDFFKMFQSLSYKSGQTMLAFFWLLAQALIGKVRFRSVSPALHQFDSLEVNTWMRAAVDARLLKAQHFDGSWREIRAMPHYDFARNILGDPCSSTKSYKDYMQARRPRSEKEMKTKEKAFRGLVRMVSLEQHAEIVVEVHLGFFGIIDGLHRSSTVLAAQDLAGGRRSWVNIVAVRCLQRPVKTSLPAKKAAPND